MTKWQKYIETPPTNILAYTFVQGTTGRVRDVAKLTPKTRKASTAHTSRGAGKKTQGLWKKTATHLTSVVMRILRPIRQNIMPGKWLAKVRGWLIKSSWRVISMLKRTGSPKPSTGSKNSNKISIWDRLFAYIGLVIFAGLSIKPSVISDPLARVAIVLLATHSIIRRFR